IAQPRISSSHFFQSLPTHPLSLLLQIFGGRIHGPSPSNFGRTVPQSPRSLRPWKTIRNPTSFLLPTPLSKTEKIMIAVQSSIDLVFIYEQEIGAFSRSKENLLNEKVQQL